MQTPPDQRHDRARSDAYRLLSALFCEPSTEAWRQEAALQRLAALLREVSPDAAAHAEATAVACTEADDALLRVEHARLFVGPFALPAAPYGSVYLEDGAVMGESTRAVADFYRQAGLVVDEHQHEAPDHVSLELEFVGYLIARLLDAIESSDQDRAQQLAGWQLEFTQSLLFPWLPTFCDRVLEHAGQEFYRSLARCLASFASTESQRAITTPVG